ncbi:MAG TPA: hypothetical protein PLW70_04110 [Bacteroidales bacterium]|jgi:hypothetical protein|nr:hypothetical protein [Bacteroidales bacterium]HQB19672.1 hypothetical protein [Bacteroidales bacterium]
MKTFFKTAMFATLFMLFVYCQPEEMPEKTPEKTEDYRDKWVGAYGCEKTYDTSNIAVIVDVQISIGDSILYIKERDLSCCGNGVRHDVIVNTDGSFANNSNNPSINGYFYNDSLFVYYKDFLSNDTLKINYKGKKLQN